MQIMANQSTTDIKPWPCLQENDLKAKGLEDCVCIESPRWQGRSSFSNCEWLGVLVWCVVCHSDMPTSLKPGELLRGPETPRPEHLGCLWGVVSSAWQEDFSVSPGRHWTNILGHSLQISQG